MLKTKTLMILLPGLLLLSSLMISQCGEKAGESDSAEPTTTATSGNSANATAGAALYKSNGCVTCHGDSGKGDGPTGKALNARDLTDAAGFKQGTSEAQISKSILIGVPGTGMAPYAAISAEDRLKIAAWIKSIQ